MMCYQNRTSPSAVDRGRWQSCQFLPPTDTETARSLMWHAAIQGIKRKQDLADLAPKHRFIPAEAVERVVGQIGEAQKAMRKLGGPKTGQSEILSRSWAAFSSRR